MVVPEEIVQGCLDERGQIERPGRRSQEKNCPELPLPIAWVVGSPISRDHRRQIA
jgi:hypothetical protein